MPLHLTKEMADYLVSLNGSGTWERVPTFMYCDLESKFDLTRQEASEILMEFVSISLLSGGE